MLRYEWIWLTCLCWVKLGLVSVHLKDVVRSCRSRTNLSVAIDNTSAQWRPCRCVHDNRKLGRSIFLALHVSICILVLPIHARTNAMVSRHVQKALLPIRIEPQESLSNVGSVALPTYFAVLTVMEGGARAER